MINVALAGGTVLVAGGATASGGSTTSSEIYTPATNRWSNTGPLTDGRYYHRVAKDVYRFLAKHLK